MSLRTSPQTGVAIRFPLAPPKGELAAKPTERANRNLSAPSGQTLIRLALAGDARATFPIGEGFGDGLPHQCEHWFAITFFFRELVQERHRAVPYGISDTDQSGTHRLRRPAARLLTNLSNFVFNSVIGCSKPPSILKARKVAEAVSRLLSNSVESSFLPLFFPNPKRKPPMVRPSGVFPHLLPNCVAPP